MHLCALNTKGEKVYPHLKGKRNSEKKGFDITLTSKKEDYHLVDVNKLIEHITNGDFSEAGRIRMKPINGGQSNGFAVRKSTMSQALIEEIEK